MTNEQISEKLVRITKEFANAEENGGGSSCAKREGWDLATSEPEDFPLGPACDLSDEGGCEACT